MLKQETIRKAFELIRKRSANHDYFFSRCDSAEWIEPLDEAGLFSSPPPAIREGGTISFPFWPESQYLSRVASDAPELVARILLKIPETDNVRTHEDFARIATRISLSSAVEWVGREIIWIEKQEYLNSLLPEALGELIEHLTISGEHDAALSLSKAVLRIRTIGNSYKDISTYIDGWHYEEFIKKYYQIVLEHTELEGLYLLCNLLEETLKVDQNGVDDDFSWIWRPAIEQNDRNQIHGDIRDVLIDGIRDGVLKLFTKGIRSDVLAQALLCRRKTVFRRIALHFLSENHTDKNAITVVCDPEYFNNEKLTHEYGRLLRAVFVSLDEQAKNTILNWIEDGPIDKMDNDDDQVLQRKRKLYWQAQHLYTLRGILPEKWERQYIEIINEIGEPEHSDYASYTTTWSGPTSPKQAEELDLMSAEEIAIFLKEWKPARTWRTPEPEGLGRVLQKIVAKSACRFLSSIDAFLDIDPTYARAIVEGFTGAVKAGTAIEWNDIIEYLTWISMQPRATISEPGNTLDCDCHWGWARKSVVRLLSEAMDGNLIEFSHRGAIWKIINTIVDDPDPTLEDDQKSMLDPATQSINTIRGDALHAVIRYSLWICRELKKERKEGEPIHIDMNSFHEVKEVLERHLNPDIDPSPAIRAIYGQWFPWLLLIDRSWTIAKIEEIFPMNNIKLWEAAWLTYLAFCTVFNEPFCVLRRQYNIGVDRIKKSDEIQSSQIGSTGEHLGEHLLIMVGRGVLHWSDEDDLVKRFFKNASVHDASHAVAFVGQSLRNETNPVNDEVIERFRKFWDEIISNKFVDGPERAKILVQFGWWFSCRRFNLEWAFEQLLHVIKATGGIEPDFIVVERLAELASKYPDQCLKVLMALLQKEGREWKALGWMESIRNVLQSALDVEATKNKARAFIHVLGARGYIQFRDLI